jgi:redox-sensing transcriptional repressor
VVDKVENKGISSAVIKRLPRYHRYLSELMNQGVERISSNELSSMMSVTASQIRQDLNNFGGFGQQGYGYNVEYLHGEISKILCVDRNHDMIIIGGGNFGHALANYERFEQKSFVTRAIFDKDPDKIGKDVRGIPILDIQNLRSYLEENNIEIAVLTIPKFEAQEIADTLVACGVKAIWNFAHLDLKVPDDVVVENVHLSESLMQLSYRLGERK